MVIFLSFVTQQELHDDIAASIAGVLALRLPGVAQCVAQRERLPAP